jgi:hypothetical protein
VPVNLFQNGILLNERKFTFNRSFYFRSGAILAIISFYS